MFDFSLSDINTDNPSILSVVYALLMSFVLSTFVSFTYEKTSTNNRSPGHFIQSMILGAIIATIVAQAIGDSIGRGLGMLGVLAMIRFRTNISQPRNMIFIFASLALGISCGVFAFNVALYGTLLFCTLAFLLSVSPLKHYVKKSYSLRVTFDSVDRTSVNSVNDYLKSKNINASLLRMDTISSLGKIEKECNWEIIQHPSADELAIVEDLSALKHVKSVKLSLRSDEEII